MSTLEALRKAIEEELYYDDKLRGRMLNIIDAAMEHEKKKAKPQYDMEEMRQRVRRNSGTARPTRGGRNAQEGTEREPDQEEERRADLDEPLYTWTTPTTLNANANEE